MCDGFLDTCVLLSVYLVSHCSFDLQVGAFLYIMASKAANALLLLVHTVCLTYIFENLSMI